MKILIVDDNSENRRLLRLIFEKHGYDDVVEAVDGLEGLATARSVTPDLIVSDALMPRMDGFQFLWAIKMDEQLKDIPFVFCSAVYTGLKDEELAFRLGAEGFISRPKEPDDVWQEMSAIMERIASGKRKPPSSDELAEEREYLRSYSEVVARKLEEKVRELEETLASRRKTEEELQKLSVAVAQSPVSVVITDAKGNIEFVNPKFCRITGYTAEELIGKNPRILKSGETSAQEYRKLWDAISAGGVWHGELHNKRKNGQLYWESATISPVKDASGVITHYIGIKEDITDKRKLEEQLLHAQKMEAVGTLAGGVAHDFNNILTAIMGYSAMLRIKMPKGDPLLGTVRHIEEAAERAAGLTAALLTCSRKQRIDTKVVDLNDVLSGIEPMLRRLVREDIELRILTSAAELPVLADRGQIEQVLLNLTTNASDAMEKGGTITVTTGVANREEEGGSAPRLGKGGAYALLTFSDTGAGMEESVRQRIFDPFFTTKEVGKGTGLGLAICYGIVTQHEGQIECTSHLGEGTTFRVFLPLARPVEVRPEAAEPAPLAGGTETILVAEDDPGTMSVTADILSTFGYTVIPAQDGERAVEIYRERWQDIDLCLMDVVMPKKRGCDTVDEIRKTNPLARVLLMSGYSDDVTALGRHIESGVTFVSKPLGVRELLQNVRDVLDR